MNSVAINYLGGEEILTHPLYLKWSQLSIENISGAVADLKTDLKGIQVNMNNLAIVSYLSTLLRAVALV